MHLPLIDRAAGPVAANRDDVGVGDVPLTVARLREHLLPNERVLVSLDGERAEETYALEHRGAGWLVFFLERGRKRDFRKHASEDAACRDILDRLRKDDQMSPR
jgi:hypothetical protein